MARDASRPDALRRQRRAGTVKDAEGTAKRREPKATVLDGPEHRGIQNCPQKPPGNYRKSYRILVSGFRGG
jgi:hypothetical protein